MPRVFSLSFSFSVPLLSFSVCGHSVTKMTLQPLAAALDVALISSESS